MKKSIVKILALSLVAVMICMTLVACGPNSNPDKAAEALEEAGYTVITDENEDEGITTVTAYNMENMEDFIVIMYFEDSGDAKDAWDEVKDEAKEYEDVYDDFVCKKSGKMIYMGTKQAVKDAK